jgi:coenzyme F420-0:L-glutamate ligase/coenzyme F420-1:gamma-L-glutamate ligase
MALSITYTALPNIPLVQPGDDVCAIIKAGLVEARIVLQDGDVIVIAQKIISKSENRYVDLAAILPSARAEELAGITGKDARHIEVVLAESAEVLRARKNVIIVAHRLGYVMANAGIDESNITHVDGPGQVLLLPVDPDRSCARSRRRSTATAPSRSASSSMTVLAGPGATAWSAWPSAPPASPRCRT